MGLFKCNCEQDVSNLKTQLRNLELELEKLRSNQNSLRGLVNRKISDPEKKPKEEGNTEESGENPAIVDLFPK